MLAPLLVYHHRQSLAIVESYSSVNVPFDRVSVLIDESCFSPLSDEFVALAVVAADVA